MIDSRQGEMRSRPSLEAIVFDMDGTLVSSLPVIYHCVNEIARKYLDKTVTVEEVIDGFGPTARVIITKLTGDLGETAQAQAVLDYYDCYNRNVPTRALVFPGITDLLSRIRSSRMHLALLTGVERTLMNYTMDAFDLKKYFDTIVVADDVSRSKPDPEGINLILERIKVDSRKAMMVGDSPADIKTGKNAGVWTGAALWSPENRGDPTTENPDFEFRSVSQLSGFLFPKNESAEEVYFSEKWSDR